MVLAIVVSGMLAGCVDRDGGGLRADAPGTFSDLAPREAGWQQGNWWAYKAVFEGNRTFDIALVVFEEREDGFTVGSNLSAGFFGLPFSGNVTRPHLNPVVGGEEWRLFDFPLEDGKSWDYPLFGYTLKATAQAAIVKAPRVGEHAGFELVATSFGRTVARYTYSPEAEWFTSLVIHEPSDGRELVRVELTDFGESYASDYFVNVPVATVTAVYPDAPRSERFSVEGSFLRLYASVALRGQLGDFRFDLLDPRGRTVMHGEVRPQGVLLDRETIESRPGSWTVDHLGLGQGRLLVEVTGVQAARQGRLLPTTSPLDDFLPALDGDVPSIQLRLGPYASEPRPSVPFVVPA